MLSRAAAPDAPTRREQNWVVVLIVFCLTSLIEAYCVSQVLAYLLPYLLHMGVNQADARTWVGVLSSLNFLVGLPLVPLWGVWADKYSRKAVIVRSALVEVVVFTLIGLSRTPIELAGSMMLVGLQLGNTGVMLATLRDLAPGNRLGLGISIFGAMGPVGFAVGPVVGGFLLDTVHLSYSQNYFVAGGVSLAAALLLTFGFHEVRPQSVPQGSVLRLAYGVIANVLRAPSTRRIFLAFGLGFFGYQAAYTYLPALVIQIYGQGPGLASAIGMVAGGAWLVGALLSPFGGMLGDKLGYRPVLAAAIGVATVTLALTPLANGLPWLVAATIVFGGCVSVFQAMIFSLLAMETPDEFRSSTLNLVFLPLYVAGIIGPLVGGFIARATGSLTPIFLLAALLYACSILPLRWRVGQARQAEAGATSGSSADAPSRRV